MQVPCAPSPPAAAAPAGQAAAPKADQAADQAAGQAVHVAHSHALLAAGIVAVLAPHMRALEFPRTHAQAPAWHPQGALLVTDLAHALELRAAATPGQDARAILVVESRLNPQKVQTLLRAGLQACVSADGSPDELHLAVQALRAGRRYFCPLACVHFGDALAQPSLTEREQDVLELLCVGLDNKSIAARLRIAPGTVKSHVKAILAKTGKASRTAAAADALCQGWVSGAR